VQAEGPRPRRLRSKAVEEVRQLQSQMALDDYAADDGDFGNMYDIAQQSNINPSEGIHYFVDCHSLELKVIWQKLFRCSESPFSSSKLETLDGMVRSIKRGHLCHCIVATVIILGTVVPLGSDIRIRCVLSLLLRTTEIGNRTEIEKC